MTRILPSLALLLAALALIACGEKDEPNVVGPPVSPVEPGEPGDAGPGSGRGGVALEQLGEFDSPVYLAQAPKQAPFYIVEQAGKIIRLEKGGRQNVFLNLSRKVTTGGEQGLLSVAFAPDYRRTRRFYVDYTDTKGDTRVVEYRRSRKDPRRADPTSARVVLRVSQPFPNHNGGLLLFGPDERLYVGLGDGGSAGDPQRTAQDGRSLLGKILRIDPRPMGKDPYRIPADNPFADDPGVRPEITALGLRNPWRFSFDRAGGALWIGDVGQSSLEEIDLVADPTSGANLGWSAFEGTEPFNEDEEAPGALDPILTYGRDLGCSITGGYVVRDPRLKTLYGRYLYADFCQGQLRSLDAAAAAAAAGATVDDRALGVQVPSVSSFAEDNRGRIYAISQDGPVYRLVPE
ncbi:MAG: PQQ-dependent sugar dehydrogenase [Actinomycetota bacterium]|nr:PQQ-dependent sugar dehydrogenase [Actinomycetota bacterium]